jgi:Flp pilus assembly protein TadD
MEALRKLTLSLQADPEDPATHNDIGTVLATLGESEKAKESCRRALLLGPGLSEARENLDALGG